MVLKCLPGRNLVKPEQCCRAVVMSHDFKTLKAVQDSQEIFLKIKNKLEKQTF